LEWEGRKVGQERIAASVWVQPVGQTQRWYTNLEMPLEFVTPITTMPVQATLDLGPGDRKTASFWCWSTTRAGFHLAAREETGSPCFSCECVPLVEKELETASQKIKGQKSHSILCGYRVVVSVAERLDNGPQLELGEYNRKIILTSDDSEFAPGSHELAVSVKGRVQGEVSIGVPADQSKVNLGIYPVTRGTNVLVPIETLKPGLKLKKVEQTPTYLDVELTQSGMSLEGVRYKMKVVVPPNRGSLPEDSTITLETIDNPPRKVRIPVVGKANIPPR
jgi:hypothetical protein